MADTNKTDVERRAEEQREQRREARRRNDENKKQAVEEQTKVTQQSVADTEQRMNASQPTPTQRENDLAKVGVDVTDKEDDGSGPDLTPQQRSMQVRDSNQTYNTRNLNQDRPNAPRPQAQPQPAQQNPNPPKAAEEKK